MGVVAASAVLGPRLVMGFFAEFVGAVVTLEAGVAGRRGQQVRVFAAAIEIN